MLSFETFILSSLLIGRINESTSFSLAVRIIKYTGHFLFAREDIGYDAAVAAVKKHQLQEV